MMTYFEKMDDVLTKEQLCNFLENVHVVRSIISAHRWLSKKDETNVGGILYGAFDWNVTPEGYEYWEKIYSELI